MSQLDDKSLRALRYSELFVEIFHLPIYYLARNIDYLEKNIYICG